MSTTQAGTGRAFLAAGLIAVTAVAASLVFPFSGEVELKSQDLRAALRGPASVQAPIVIVAIDDASFERIDVRWPWPRQLLAAGVDALAAEGARVVGIDIMLGDAGYDPAEDLALAGSIARAGNVVLPSKLGTSEQGTLRVEYYDAPLPLYAASALAVGYVNLAIDTDGLARRVVPTGTLAGVKRRAFAVELLRAAGLEPRLPGPADVIVDFAAPGAFPVIPFFRVLDKSAPPGVFRDAIVLVGAWFKESHDLLLTPVETTTGLYGVEIHANVANTLAGGVLLRPTRRGVDLLVLVALAVAASLALVRLRPLVGLMATLAALVAYLMAAYLLYADSALIVEVARPVTGLALTWVGSVLYRYLVVDRQRRKIRSTFSRFVSKEVVDSLLDSESAVELGGEMREVVVFFSDIVGFTPLSETMSPPQIVDMLNEYFTEMTEVIFRHQGTVNKYIGDAIMAFYGAPVPIPNAAEAAVRACLQMREVLAGLNRRWAAAGRRSIAMGMGLHKGRVLVGNIGSPRQMEYTVIGDVVNVGSRIEGLTRRLGVDLLISDEIYRDVSDLVAVTTFPPVEVKGKSERILVHGVEGLREVERA